MIRALGRDMLQSGPMSLGDIEYAKETMAADLRIELEESEAIEYTQFEEMRIYKKIRAVTDTLYAAATMVLLDQRSKEEDRVVAFSKLHAAQALEGFFLSMENQVKELLSDAGFTE